MAISTQVPFPFLKKMLETAVAKREAARRAATTYIVDDGKDVFYQAAHEYYKTWGYSKRVPVKSLEAIVDHLNKGSGVDYIRIVSHGDMASTEQSMELPIFGKGTGRPSSGTEWTYRESLLFVEPGTYVGEAVEDIMKSTKAGGFLTTATRLALPPGALQDQAPAVEPADDTWQAAKDAGLMQDTTGRYQTQYYEWSPAQAAVAATVVLALVNAYRGSRRGKLSDADLGWIDDTFTRLKKTAIERTESDKQAALETFLGSFEGDADAAARGYAGVEETLRELVSKKNKTALSKAQTEANGSSEPGTFYAKLSQAREKLKPGAHIEICGCNVGRDQIFMDRFQKFFTIPDGRAPSVSAPTLFQVYTKMAVSTFDPTPAGGTPNLGSRPFKFTRVSAGLANDDFIINMSATPRPFTEVVEDFYRGRSEKMRKALHKLSFKESTIASFNPDLDFDAIPAFAPIWLRLPTDEERQALADASLVEGAPFLLNRTPDAHELKVRKPEGSKQAEMEVKVRAVAADWVRRVLLEDPTATTRLEHGFPITYLTANSGLEKDLKQGDPILFAGHSQFWRHINWTQARTGPS